MSDEEKPVNCRCGREPEIDKHLGGYNHSIHCKCGGEKINFLVQSETVSGILETWDSLINKKQYKKSVEIMNDPDQKKVLPTSPILDGFARLDNNPYRKFYDRIGGTFSGGGGPC